MSIKEKFEEVINMSRTDKLLVGILVVLILGIGFNTYFLVTGSERYGQSELTTNPSKVTNSKSVPEFVPYDTPPREKQVTAPDYPEEAEKAGIEGTVYLRIAIDSTGKVVDVKVAKGVHKLLDSAAVAAAWTWTYYPAKSKGKPVAVWIGQPVTFKLSKEEK